jgi:membrane protease YdiL (CAAX protease family)
MARVSIEAGQAAPDEWVGASADGRGSRVAAVRGTVPHLTNVSPARFFVLTYALSWLIWIPLDLAHLEIGPLVIPEGTSTLIRLLGVLMPAVAAMLLSARAGGRRELGSMLSRLRIWRVGLRWWAAALLVQPMILIASGLLANLIAGNDVVPFVPFDSLGTLIVTGVFLLLAVLGEEIGWHGVALPALQQRMSIVRAALTLGVLWAMWHLPFWLLLDSYAQYGIGYIGLNLLLIVPFSAYISWFFNNARFSILLPVAFHLAFNLVNTAPFAVTMDISAFAILIGAEWVLGLLVLPRLPESVAWSRSTDSSA